MFSPRLMSVLRFSARIGEPVARMQPNGGELSQMNSTNSAHSSTTKRSSGQTKSGDNQLSCRSFSLTGLKCRLRPSRAIPIVTPASGPTLRDLALIKFDWSMD
jgi:hypothetical protein